MHRYLIAGLSFMTALSLAQPVSAAPSMPPAQGAPPTCADVAADAATAQGLAKACQRRVAIETSRSEYAQVIAEPNGKLTFESAVVPQRARRADGRWSDVDLTLKRGKDGLLRPAVSVADVAFSAGGTGPMATVRRGGKTFTMSWPATLPVPTVSGDSVTYPNVLSDVDLVVRATRAGFTHVLVVKTAAAAASVKQFKFTLGGDAALKSLPDGSLRATVGNTVIASAKPATMWDSTPGKQSSSAAEPGDRARIKPLGVQVSGRDLVLRPNAELLGAGAQYPVFVDPYWSVGENYGQKWAYSTNNGTVNTDYQTARVGKDYNSSTLYRSYFEFPMNNGAVSLSGKHIASAYVQMKLWHSAACANAWSEMWLAPVINATMRADWNTMALNNWMSAASGHANKAGGCGANQPDMIMNFGGDSVRHWTQVGADNGWGTLTVGFSAKDAYGNKEWDWDRWMKYYPDDARLIVEYDSKPTAPIDLQIAGVACLPSGTLTVGTLTPNFSSVHPDADTNQTLTAHYEWVEVPAGGITDSTPRKTAPSAVSVSANGRATTSNLPTLTGNVTYAYRTVSSDPYGLWSWWSGWCYFTVDTAVPNVALRVMEYPQAPGAPGKFRISSTSTDVRKFRYGWGGATIEALPDGSDPSMISVILTLTAPKFGKNILYVASVDATGNVGYGSKQFTIGRPSPSIAQWPLEAYPGMTQSKALEDQQPALGGNTPLVIDGASTWDADARLMGGSTLNPRASASIHSNGPVVADTTKSFSVAAWLRPTDTGNGYNAAFSQLGSVTSGFMLYAPPEKNRWGFGMYDNDSTSTAGTFVFAPLTLNTWQHVAVAYDGPGRELRIYLNGALVERKTRSAAAAPWVANGKFHIGWSKWGAGTTATAAGQIADVQVFDRMLVPQDFTGAVATDTTSGGFNETGALTPIPVGSWNFNSAVDCYDISIDDTCEAPDTTGFSRWLALSRGADIYAGRGGSAGALSLDYQYFPEEGNTGGEAESARSARKSNGTWQNAPVLRTDQSYTIAGWFNTRDIAPTGNRTFVSQDGLQASGFYLGVRPHDAGGWTWGFMTADTDTADPQTRIVKAKNAFTTNDVGRWVHLVAVYDAQFKEMRLYVNGVLEGKTARPATPWQAAGPLVLGRAKWSGNDCDFIDGGIDDLATYQGAMTDGAVALYYAAANQN